MRRIDNRPGRIENAAMKHHLRKEMKATLAAMPEKTAKDKSYAACKSLLELQEYRDAQVVMLYLPIPCEVDTAEIALHAWQADKTVLAPKIGPTQKHLLPLEIHSLDDGLTAGQLGILEPTDGQVWPMEDIDFIIVPALAYDRNGGRLGRGGGFYDRFLAHHEVKAVTCGLGFSEQLVDELPMHTHDYPVQILVTDTDVIRFQPS